MRKIGDLVCVNMQYLSSYILVYIFKMFRFIYVDYIYFMKQFGEIVFQRIFFLGVQGVMYFIFVCLVLRILDERVMNVVVVFLFSRVVYCRSKDVVKILWFFGILNYKLFNIEEFYFSFINEIYRKMFEFNQYLEYFFICLIGLVFFEYFLVEFINVVLSLGFVKLV